MVVVRDVLRGDLDLIHGIATTAVFYVGDGPDDGGNSSCRESIMDVQGARVAEDDSGIVGYARTRLRRQRGYVEGELTLMFVARHARGWAVDRLLVDDMRRQAAAHGGALISVVVRPPIDVFFRGLGAEVRGLVGSWSGRADPRIHLELLCSS